MDSRPVSPDVIVVGAGFAGLSAACALAERGARITVLEARPTLGGRATAFTDPQTGERVDNGQHILVGAYRETFTFLRRIGTDQYVRLAPQLAIDVIDRAGRSSRLVCPPLPSPLHLAGGVFEWEALRWRDRLSVLRLREPLAHARARLRGRTDRLAASPGETVRQWLERNGQTPKLVEMLWEPLAVAALNQPIDQAAAEPFTRVLALMFGSDPRDAAVALPLKPLDELYAGPARAFIEARGGTVITQAEGRVIFGDRAVSHVEAQGKTLHAGAVICAVPWYALPDVLVPDPSAPRPSPLDPVVQAASKTPACPIVTVHLWFDRVVLETAFVGLPGRINQWVFDKRETFGERASHLSTVSSGAASVVSRSNEDLIDLALSEIRDAIPEARDATVRRATVIRERRATFSLAPGMPPRPATRTPVKGLFLAGDWIDTGLPATIESAVISGHWAAAAVSE
jgi:squalene-associated FAD-dependent desaturase